MTAVSPANEKRAAAPRRQRNGAVLADSFAPRGFGGGYSAGTLNGNIALWRPQLKSADADIMRDAAQLRARARDLERNHPFAQSVVRARRLGVVGRRMRYSCRPDFRFLGIDQDEAMRWASEFERVWETYAHGPDRLIDAGRRLDFTRMMALIHDRDFVDGESLVTAEWDPSRRFRTCFQVVDCDRLSNPDGQPETAFLKGGVALDGLSAPIGYHIRQAHPNDLGYVGARTALWSFVRRETDWGRMVCNHSFESIRPGQTRGVTAFASVIIAMKMGQEYADAELQSAILRASYAAVLTSQQNHAEALKAIGGMPASPEEGDSAASIASLAEEYLEAQLQHHESIKLRFNGSQIPVLFPNEKLDILQPGNSAASLADFNSWAIKSYAAGTGTDSVSVSQDYSSVNYSSGKMAAATSFRYAETVRDRLISSVAMPMVASFLEELVVGGSFPLPKGLSQADFYDAKDALIRGTFLTLGAPNLEPMKEAQAAQMRLQMGTETLQNIAGEQGEDYIELLDQRAREQAEMAARGLLPTLMPLGAPAPASPAADDKDKTET